MKKFSILLFIFPLFICVKTSATIRLIALTNAGTPTVTLQWNMVNYPGNTAYTLFKSIDGVIWKPAAANPVFRNYTTSTILAYRDNFSNEQQLYYRVKVYDTNENSVEISNTTLVSNPVNNHSIQKKNLSEKRIIPESPIVVRGSA